MAKRSRVRLVSLLAAFPVLMFSPKVKAAETQILNFSANLDNLRGGGALNFHCEHLSSALPRTCEVWALVYLSGQPTYFTLTREYLGDHVIRDSASIAGPEAHPTVAYHMSFWSGRTKLAEGDTFHGYGENMQLASKDFLASFQDATSAMIEVSDKGRSTRYQFSYQPNLAKCIEVGASGTDAEFDAMAQSYGGRVVCEFYQHLGTVKITSLEEASLLSKTEINFLQTKMDNARAEIKRLSSPETLTRLLEQLGAIPSR